MTTGQDSARQQGPARGSRGQLALLRGAVRGRRPRAPEGPAAVDPVAAVLLDVPLPHLDRAFDYGVPQSMAATAVPGTRVRVRFAGQEVGGFVAERRGTSSHVGELTPIRRSVSPERVLDAGVLRAARAVADATAGTLADVLRLAVPPRHAETERRPANPRPRVPARPDPAAWDAYPGGEAFLDRVAAGGDARAVWTALPGTGDAAWPAALAVAALAAASADRGVLAVLPDHRDVDRLVAALASLGAADQLARLTADSGPARRYGAFLRASRGQARIVVGTRAAALAPVQGLGLVICWDDGDDLHAEPRSPYPHARDVLRIRAEQAGAAGLFGGLTRSVEAEMLLRSGWARSLQAERRVVRARTPRVVVSGDDDLRDPAARTARLPSLALRTARVALRLAGPPGGGNSGRGSSGGGPAGGGTLALDHAGGEPSVVPTGPVLVQVPRAGYVPGLACERCRGAVTCGACHGPVVATSAETVPSCSWCARPAGEWTCPTCRSDRLRSVRVGVRRTAEEIGRALPGVPVRVSGAAAGVLADIGPEPALVLATPGAEPWAAGGYAAALLLDGWVPVSRPDLRAGEEALRRWTAAAALVRPGGVVVLVGEASLAPVQALVRWDPGGFAARELGERSHLRLPPAALLAEVVGAPDGVAAFAAALRLPDGIERLGPVPVDAPPSDAALHGPQVRLLFRASLEQEAALVGALATTRRVLSATKAPHPPRVRVRPAIVT